MASKGVVVDAGGKQSNADATLKLAVHRDGGSHSEPHQPGNQPTGLGAVVETKVLEELPTRSAASGAR